MYDSTCTLMMHNVLTGEQEHIGHFYTMSSPQVLVSTFRSQASRRPGCQSDCGQSQTMWLARSGSNAGRTSRWPDSSERTDTADDTCQPPPPLR